MYHWHFFAKFQYTWKRWFMKLSLKHSDNRYHFLGKTVFLNNRGNTIHGMIKSTKCYVFKLFLVYLGNGDERTGRWQKHRTSVMLLKKKSIHEASSLASPETNYSSIPNRVRLTHTHMCWHSHLSTHRPTQACRCAYTCAQVIRPTKLRHPRKLQESSTILSSPGVLAYDGSLESETTRKQLSILYKSSSWF